MGPFLAGSRTADRLGGRPAQPPAGLAEMPPTKGLFHAIWEVDRSWMPELRRLAATEAAGGKTVSHLKSLDELDAFTAGL